MATKQVEVFWSFYKQGGWTELDGQLSSLFIYLEGEWGELIQLIDQLFPATNYRYYISF